MSTNLPFLAAVLADPDFQAGRVTTSFIDERPQLLSARRPADRGTRLLHLPGRDHGEPAATGRGPQVVEPVGQAARGCDLERPRRRTGPGSCCASWARRGSRRRLREQTARGRHRHHVPRRAPVAAGHPGAHPGPARRRPVRGAHRAAAAVAGVLGRRDLRRGAAVPGRGPVGPARRAARGGAQHLHADAAARAQHRRLHALPDRGDRRVRRGGRAPPGWTSSGSSTRSTTSRRCARPSTRCGPPGRRVAEVALCYTGDLSDPAEDALHAGLLPAAGRADRRGRARTCWRSRTWPGCCGRRRRARW